MANTVSTRGAASQIEVITDQKIVAATKEVPLISFKTGLGETFHVRINQPTGRALLIAVHL